MNTEPIRAPADADGCICPQDFVRPDCPAHPPDEPSEMAKNQHHEAVNPASVRIALVAALDQWEKSGCDCCSPTVADDALDSWGDVSFWERMRRFGIELAQTAQNVIDQEAEGER